MLLLLSLFVVLLMIINRSMELIFAKKKEKRV
jgi:hypothetical protein